MATFPEIASILLNDLTFDATLIILVLYAIGLKFLSENVLRQITVSERYVVLSKRDSFMFALYFAFIFIYLGLICIGIYLTLTSLIQSTGILKTMAYAFFAVGAILIAVGGMMAKQSKEI